MSRFTDFFWPTLDQLTPAELAEDQMAEEADISAARMEGWGQNPGLALEEARRLVDSEEHRRRTTEGKASTYLLFAAAFAAALIPFLPGILERKTGSAPRWLIAIILIVAALYLVGAGISAFRALRVGTYHRLDVADLVRIWQHKNPTRALIRDTLVVSRMNYRSVNEKVAYVKLVHEFMARSFITFGVLVVVEAGWEAVETGIEIHQGHSTTNSKGESKWTKSGATAPTPRAPSSQSDKPTSSIAEPSQSDAVSGATKPSINQSPHSTQPAENAGGTSPGINGPNKSGVNGPASAPDASLGKQLPTKHDP